MNDLITNIFNLFDFKKIDGSEIALFKSESITDFWLVCKGEPKIFTYEYQAELLKLCQEICDDPALEKNLNLLCLWQVDVIDHSTISQLHLLEEDIYFFKKHVLYYTEQELVGLNEELIVNSLSDLLTRYPVDPNVYNRYKQAINSGTWESLLYRVCIKLVFVKIIASEGDDIDNLYLSHDKKLTNDVNLKDLDDVIQKMKMQDIDNLDKKQSFEEQAINLLELINSSLTEGS
jgi:hypothetical protein